MFNLKDFLGNIVYPGDEVVYLTHTKVRSWLSRGKVIRTTEKCAFVNDTRKKGHKIIDLSAIERNSKYSLFEAD